MPLSTYSPEVLLFFCHVSRDLPKVLSLSFGDVVYKMQNPRENFSSGMPNSSVTSRAPVNTSHTT